jgi:chromosome segregation ATPase
MAAMAEEEGVGDDESASQAAAAKQVIEVKQVAPKDGTAVAALDATLSSALLIEAAEIENRLRDHVMELLKPVFRRAHTQEDELKNVNSKLAGTTDQVKDLVKYQQGAASSVEQIERFRVELAKWDNERRSHEQTLSDRLSMQEIEINSIRRMLEKKSSDESGLNRAWSTLNDNMARTQQETNELRRFCSDRLDMNRDKISKLRDEFETRSLATENKLHRCMDNQTSLETATAHTRTELNRMSKTVLETITVMDELDQTKASVACIDKQQQEFSDFAHQVSDQVGVLRQQFGTLVDDVKAHFETASKVVATSTAKQVADMRESYRSEVARMDTALNDIESFLKAQGGTETAFKDDVESVRSMVKQEDNALRSLMEDFDSKRGKTISRLELEVQTLRRKLGEMEGKLDNTSFGDGGGGGIKGGSDLMALLVESLQLSSALAWQDNMDRKRVALFGLRGDKRSEKLPQIDSGVKSMNTPRRPDLKVADQDQEIMSLDQRCLSCNSNRNMALAGFKIACLQYNPTPVEYQKNSYSREELLRLQTDLLKQAKELLMSP